MPLGNDDEGRKRRVGRNNQGQKSVGKQKYPLRYCVVVIIDRQRKMWTPVCSIKSSTKWCYFYHCSKNMLYVTKGQHRQKGCLSSSHLYTVLAVQGHVCMSGQQCFCLLVSQHSELPSKPPAFYLFATPHTLDCLTTQFVIHTDCQEQLDAWLIVVPAVRIQ